MSKEAESIPRLSGNTSLQSSHPLCCHPAPPRPSSPPPRLHPFFSLHFYCTRAHSSPFPLLPFSPNPSFPPPPRILQRAPPSSSSDRGKIDRCVGKEMQPGEEDGNQQSARKRETERERERKRGLCRRLCAGGERERPSCANQREEMEMRR